MFSLGRKIQLSLRHNVRPFCSQSQGSTSSSSSSSFFSSFVGPTHGERIGDFEAFLRAITSGVVVVASTLGFWYWSSLSSSASNSLQSFSDFANQDQLQQKRQSKPSRFLFNGILLFINHLRCILHLYYICFLIIALDFPF